MVVGRKFAANRPANVIRRLSANDIFDVVDRRREYQRAPTEIREITIRMTTNTKLIVGIWRKASTISLQPCWLRR
jgi:hypothetical protein